jgi:hypothetical protein
MTTDTSATVRTETPQVDQTTRTNTIMNALTRRAQAVLNDRLIDPQTRAIIRYGLETNDPWLAELVRRADAGESVDTLDFSQTPEGESSEEKIETLSEIICRAGDESAAALLVLMGTVENSTHPKLLVNTAKHFAFTRCGEATLYGMVDAQIATIEGELLA